MLNHVAVARIVYAHDLGIVSAGGFDESAPQTRRGKMAPLMAGHIIPINLGTVSEIRIGAVVNFHFDVIDVFQLANLVCRPMRIGQQVAPEYNNVISASLQGPDESEATLMRAGERRPWIVAKIDERSGPRSRLNPLTDRNG